MDWEKTVPERFRATYDSVGDRFIILDTWHPQIKNMNDFTQEVPDNSPAVKIVAGTEMNAVIGLMKKMGWINGTNMPTIIKDTNTSGIINNNGGTSFPKKYVKELFNSWYKNKELERVAEIEKIVNQILSRKI